MSSHTHDSTGASPVGALPATEVAGPAAMVIFGATGDLTRRKLIPALYNLSVSGLLSRDFAIVGLGRSDHSADTLRDQLREFLKKQAPGEPDSDVVERLVACFRFIAGDFKDPVTYAKLTETLAEVERAHGTAGNILFYLATPPSFFSPIVEQLARVGLTREDEGHWRRIVIEKPFGHDLGSARALNAAVRSQVAEHQIYRIDHYLGKETVQNILVFRFGNGIFEPVWNRRYVDHVQITVSEELGVEHRASYYEEAGALRDMIPNHLFQLLALTAMEPPNSFEADAVRNEKAKVLSAVAPFTNKSVLMDAVRGQYDGGTIDGTIVPAYRDEPRVAPESPTDTYAALKLQIDSWRWAGVPFYLRTGKRLPARVSEIAIHFKSAPLVLFKETPVDDLSPNLLVVRIQPREGIALSFGAKVPGQTMRIGSVDMDFCYADYFNERPSTGYETLLYDAMLGDATLFQRGDNVELAWKVVEPVLDVWGALPPRGFPNYVAGSAGPDAAEELLARDGRAWRPIR